MGTRIEMEKGFVDHFIEHSIDSRSFLAKIDALVDWRPFEKYLAKTLKRGPAAAGQPAYPDMVMFKAILLQFFYGLSDEALSHALGDRISFIHFVVGLPFGSSKPDGSTIGRFRQHLQEKGCHQHLLDLFNQQQIEQNGLLVKRGAAVDATLIASSRRPRKVIDVEAAPRDRQEDETPTEPEEVKVSYSDDPDAKWTVKGGELVYGYKIHGGVDLEHGFILGGHVTGANVSDTRELPQVVEECRLPRGARVETDKGYAGEPNRRFLDEAGYGDGIMRRGKRNQPLSAGDKIWNAAISKTRWVIVSGLSVL
jgi:IS5 family transposase